MHRRSLEAAGRTGKHLRRTIGADFLEIAVGMRSPFFSHPPTDSLSFLFFPPSSLHTTFIPLFTCALNFFHFGAMYKLLTHLLITYFSRRLSRFFVSLPYSPLPVNPATDLQWTAARSCFFSISLKFCVKTSNVCGDKYIRGVPPTGRGCDHSHRCHGLGAYIATNGAVGSRLTHGECGHLL